MRNLLFQGILVLWLWDRVWLQLSQNLVDLQYTTFWFKIWLNLSRYASSYISLYEQLNVYVTFVGCPFETWESESSLKALYYLTVGWEQTDSLSSAQVLKCSARLLSFVTLLNAEPVLCFLPSIWPAPEQISCCYLHGSRFILHKLKTAYIKIYSINLI